MSHNTLPGNPEFRVIHEVLAAREINQPEAIAYTFLQDGESITEQLNYRDLGIRSRKLAAYLESRNLAGERCLILLNSSIDYVVAFVGCILAGVIAVPAYPPRPNKIDERLRSILVDSSAKIIIAPEDILEKIPASFEDVNNFSDCEITDVNRAIQSVSDQEVSYPTNYQHISEDDIAYLQYTSGSTGNPKGVMVSHRNLLRNIYLIKHASQYSDPAVHVTWLPIFHDFGLVNGICHPLYAGQQCVFMPPVAFTQNPLRWLKAISDFGGSVSGAPNFAYEYCVERLTEEDMLTLDLSCWEVAFSGAEPVRPDTLNAFLKKFSSCGLKQNVFCPAYGLAEATLYVSTIAANQACKIKAFDKTALEKNEIKSPLQESNSRELVACGSAQYGQKIIIVDPYTRKLCSENEIGEIWVCDESIPCGYWNKAKESEETFANYIDLPDDENLPGSGKNAGPFLRTGDMGFLDEHELFIVSRLKDLIIIRGANHYPQDIEVTVEQSHEALRAGGVAAFSVTTPSGEEGLVIVQELERQWRKNFDGPAITESIRRQISEKHNLEIHELVLISPASIAKTTSGKIQRRLCRAQFQAGELATLYHWQNPVSHSTEIPQKIQTEFSAKKSDITEFIRVCIARESGRNANEINLDASLADFGLGSLAVVRISGELERKLKIRVSPTCAYDYPRIDRLAEYLFNLIQIHEVEHSDTISTASSEAKKDAVNSNEEIAIIGLSCRFPGSKNADEFWQLLKDGRNAITSTSVRWQSKQNTAADFAGLLAEVDKFDAEFFGIPTREATEMDPQQRLLLELSWEALEAAAIPPSALSDTDTGVFIGISTRDYSLLHREYSAHPNAYSGSGNAASICANRLSYFYNLHGPSLAVDTACSSSLVAVHQACHAIRQGECSMAIVGGVNMILASELSDIFTLANMLSPDGLCKTFDANANGYVRGEGGGVIIIKSLSQALEDGDSVLAVIRGSAINQDGRTNGLTAPNGLAQQKVIRAALQNAGLEMHDINYVEAHGTGTPLGDPIEFNSLVNLMGQENIAHPCLVGSVKTNIGHLEAAAGMAGLIKIVLSLQHELIPQHCNYHTPNPLLAESSNIKIANTITTWARSTRPRHAGINSFGFGGTNAHVIISESPSTIESRILKNQGPRSELIAISAKSPQAFTNTLETYTRWSKTISDNVLTNISFTSLLGREHFDYRTAVVVSPGESLSEKLASLKMHHAPQKPQVAWLFSGQGSQYARMGEDMLLHSEIYAHYFNECSLVVEGLTGKSLHECLYASSEIENEFLSQPVFTQAAIFSVEYALAKTYLHLGAVPEIVLGHSIGEYVAASIAGIFSAEDALKMLIYRARAMETLSAVGGMLSLEIDRKKLQILIAETSLPIDLAANNSAHQQVVSASQHHLEEFAAHLLKQGIEAKWLRVTHAFHSRSLEPVAKKIEKFFNSISFSAPNISIVSSKTGKLVTNEMSCANYWIEQMLMPVEFSAAIATITAKYTSAIFLEIGTKPTLLGLIKQDYRNAIGIPSLREKKPAYEQWLKSIAELYCLNVPINFAPLFENKKLPPMQLPHYAFERNSYWLTADKSRTKLAVNSDMFALEKLSIANSNAMYFELTFKTSEKDWVKEHQLFGRNLFPATAYIELLTQILTGEFGNLSHESYELRDFVIASPLFIDNSSELKIQFEILPQITSPQISQSQVINLHLPTKAYWVNCYSSADEGQSWQLNVSLEIFLKEKGELNSQRNAPSEFQNQCKTNLSPTTLYQNCAKRGLNYGEQFQLVESLWTNGNEKFLAHLKHASRQEDMVAELLDACAQMIGGCIPGDDLWVPVSFDSLLIQASLSGEIVSLADVEYRLDSQLSASVLIYADKKLAVEIQGLNFARVYPEQFQEKNMMPSSYQLEWYPATINKKHNAQRQTILLGNNTELNFTLAETLRADQMPCRQYFLSSLEAPETLDHIISGLNQPTESEKIIIINCVDYQTDNALPHMAMETMLHKLIPLLKNILNEHTYESLSIVLLGKNSLHGDQDIPDHTGLVLSALSGLIKTLNAEYPSINFCLIDMSAQEQDVQQCNEILLGLDLIETESLVRIRNNQLFLQRMTQCKTTIENNIEVARNAWHIISGGLGELGFATAEWLINQGATHLILLSRYSPSETLFEKITQLRKNGTNLEFFSADITSLESLQIVFEFIKRSGVSLRGIVHAAGTLNDRPFANMEQQHFVEVMKPKIVGAWNLFTCSKEHTLDYFVCYSSIASILGTESQANYASANAILDYFVHWARHEKTPASAINWGPWDEYGMAIKSGVLAYAKTRGIEALPPTEGFLALGQHLASNASNSIVIKANWEKFHRTLIKPGLGSLLEKLLPTKNIVQLQSNNHQDDLLSNLIIADIEKQKPLLSNYLYQLLNSSFGKIPADKNFELLVPAQLGMDSLMSIELRNIIKRNLRVDVPVQIFVSGVNIGEIIDFIINRLALNHITGSSEQSLTEVEEFTL